MREVILITSRNDTFEKTQLLIDNIYNFKSLGYDIILSSNYSLDSSIQSAVNYYFFQKDNEAIDIKLVNYAERTNFKMWCLNREQNHSYAHFNLIKNGLRIAKSLNYDVAHVINYDIFLNNIKTTLDEHVNVMNEFNGVFYYYNNDYLKNQFLSFQSVFFSVKVDWVIEKVNVINSPTDYIKTCDNALEFVVGILFNDNIKVFDNFNSIIDNEKLYTTKNVLCMMANDGDDSYIYLSNKLKDKSKLKIITNNGILNKIVEPQKWTFDKLGNINFVYVILNDKVIYKQEYIDEYFKKNNQLSWSKLPDYIKINVKFDENKIYLSSEKNVKINLKILRNNNRIIYVNDNYDLTNVTSWFSPSIKISESTIITVKIEIDNVWYVEDFTQDINDDIIFTNIDNFFKN